MVYLIYAFIYYYKRIQNKNDSPAGLREDLKSCLKNVS